MNSDDIYFSIKKSKLDSYINANESLKGLEISSKQLYLAICEDIDSLFKFFNIPQNKSGHTYWQEATYLYLVSNEIKPSVCKEIYPNIAKKYGKTRASIDRAMNRCMENVLYHISKTSTNFISQYFKDALLYPKNSEILAMIVETISSTKFQKNKANL